MRCTHILLIALLGCSKPVALVPAPAADEEPGVGRGALAADAGIAIEVRADAWRGHPEQLTTVLPLRVTIDNGSERSLRVRYEDIYLRADDGELYAALPPFDIHATEIEEVDVFYPQRGLYVPPYATQRYPYAPLWGGPFTYDPLFYEDGWSQLRAVELPTADMVGKALPEGVIEPGGRVTGFVYTRPLTADTERVEFTLALVDAVSSERFGEVRVPFDIVPRRLAAAP